MGGAGEGAAAAAACCVCWCPLGVWLHRYAPHDAHAQYTHASRNRPLRLCASAGAGGLPVGRDWTAPSVFDGRQPSSFVCVAALFPVCVCLDVRTAPRQQRRSCRSGPSARHMCAATRCGTSYVPLVRRQQCCNMRVQAMHVANQLQSAAIGCNQLQSARAGNARGQSAAICPAATTVQGRCVGGQAGSRCARRQVDPTSYTGAPGGMAFLEAKSMGGHMTA